MKIYKITVNNKRPTAPSLTGGSDNWVSTVPTIKVSSAGTAISGVKHYEYYKSTSSTAPTDSTTATGTTSGNVTISDEGTTYIWYRTVSNNGFKSAWSSFQVTNLDTTTPEVGTVWTFNYTGGEQEFITPCTGTYKLETWGAQGGSGSSNNYSNDKAGYGGYSFGSMNIDLSSKLYINVGGAGAVVNSINGSTGGYNGGGNGEATCEGFPYPGGGGGGGATHISNTSGILPTLSNKIGNIIIVAGGGGGAGLYNGGYNQGGGYAGSGGGFKGGSATTTNLRPIIGGTQMSGYSFGLGETSTACHFAVDGNWGNGGGGGGFYGGFASGYTTGAYTNGGGAGGSGYIGNTLLTNKSMYCYNCGESSEESTKTISTTCTSETPTENCSKQGNCYTRITYL